MGSNNPSLVITVCHSSVMLVMPNGDPRNGIFDPALMLMKISYILFQCPARNKEKMTVRANWWTWKLRPTKDTEQSGMSVVTCWGSYCAGKTDQATVKAVDDYYRSDFVVFHFELILNIEIFCKM